VRASSFEQVFLVKCVNYANFILIVTAANADARKLLFQPSLTFKRKTTAQEKFVVFLKF
jgi:hypothetical protein